MAERSLRGSRLGATSYEDDRGVEFVARKTVSFECPEGHLVTIPFAHDADIPARWQCPKCGADALVRDGATAPAKAVKPGRTHWDMLLERRSVTELEELLQERLGLLRSGALIGDRGTPRTAGREASNRRS